MVDDTCLAAAVADLAPDPIVILDGELVLRWLNRACGETFGWDPAAWVGRSVVPLIHPDDLPVAAGALQTVVSKSVGTPVEVRVRDAGGTYRWTEVRGRPLFDDPRIAGVILVVRDLTDRHRWEVAADDAALLRTIVQHAPGITMLVEADGTVRRVSGSLTRLLGHDPELVEGRPLADLASPTHRESVAAELARAAAVPGRHRFEAMLAHADGVRTVPFEVRTVNLCADPVVGGLICTLLEVTELHAARERLTHLATHDPLTGLANRTLLFEHLRAAVARARRTGGDVAVLFVDLDGFKAVNDRLGHTGGDQLLAAVARRLRGTVRAADVVARVGGDEFVVLCPDTDPEGARELAARITAVLSGPIVVAAGTAEVTASVGVAVSRGGADEPGELLRRADDDMYQDKARRRSTSAAGPPTGT